MDKYEDFISTVSHELRTPLTSIRGFSQTMLESWDKLDDVNKKKFLKIIEEQSNRLINLVENMLFTATNIILKDVPLKPVVETVVSVLKNQYPARNFKIDISEKLPAVLADKDKLQQVLTNLIENAAKYSDDDITISAAQSEDFISIKIIDTGVGIEKCDYGKIFQKFSRIDNPLTRKTEGSGLGLYITKNIVEQMGGNVGVNCNNNMTTFEVKLPVSSLEGRLQCSR
jgi:signal transduction histidine kinase